MGQSLWLDNITRRLLASGTLRDYIQELSVTGLTSNPTVFYHAIKDSHDYDDAIHQNLREGKSGEALFFELAIEDLRQAADLFRPIHDQTNGVDGWVSLEVSPLLAHDTAATIAAAKELYSSAGRPNLFIKIPGTKEGLPAIEESIFAGVPINVTLLFSREQYVAAGEPYLRGVGGRIAAGLNPEVGSVASLFISRWDVAVMGKVSESLRSQLGIAIAQRTYEAYRGLLGTPRWQRVFNAGARAQRLLWASTGTKDPDSLEWERLQGIRDMANEVIDTSSFNVHQLKEKIQQYAQQGLNSRQMTVTLLSFGYSFGIPFEADLMFDVRFLPNPYFVEELKRLKGDDPKVAEYVLQWEETKEFLERIQDFIRFLFPLYMRERKTHLTIAVGCTGGRHRSIVIAHRVKEMLSDELGQKGVFLTVRHRDSEKG